MKDQTKYPAYLGYRGKNVQLIQFFTFYCSLDLVVFNILLYFFTSLFFMLHCPLQFFFSFVIYNSEYYSGISNIPLFFTTLLFSTFQSL